MEKELSLFCKNKSTEKFLDFKVLKTIGKVVFVKSLRKIRKNEKKPGKVFFIFARGKKFKGS